MLPAGLHLVATPIGNLGDVSPRARDTLAGCDRILCEDTRHTGRLLHHLGIDQPQEEGLRVWRNQRRTEGGLLDLTLVTQNSCIKDIQFTGSPLFLQPDGLRQVENYLRGCFLSPADVGERVINLYQTLGLKSAGTSPADFLILVGDTIGQMAP